MSWQVNAQTIVIGTATTATGSTDADPIHGYYKAFRYQVIYTAAELSASLTPYDQITALGFSILGDYAGGDLLGYTIKMGHTTASNGAAHISTPTTVVKNPFNYNPTVTAAGVFDMIPFDNNFIWNGVDNIVIDICSNGPNPFTGPYGQVRATTSVNGAARFYRSDSGTACDVNTATISTFRPNIQFNYNEGTPPTCLPPSGFVASAFTSTSATISWNAATPVPGTGYEYYYSTSAAVPTGAGTPTTALTANLTGLNAATTYYVWLRSNCSSGDFSSWNGPYSFATNCGTVTNFVQGFESTTGALFPLCWSKVGTAGNAYTQNGTGISGARLLYMYTSTANSQPVVAMIPVSNAAAGTHRMVMKVRANVTVGETIQLGYLTNPTDATTFVAINSIVTNSLTVVQNFVTVPTGMPAGDVVFALRTGNSAFASVLIDDITWEPIPAVAPNCSAILTPTNAAINVSSGKITWANNIDATGYKISAGTSAGATNVLNMFDVGSVTNYTIPTAPGTTYYVTLFPYNASGTATGCTEISFTTCDAFPVPFTEGFNSTSTTESCWTVLNVNNDVDAWDLNYATNPIEGNQSAMLYTDGNGGNNDDWLISPKITLTGNQRVRFQRKVQSTGEPNDFRMLVSTTGVAPADFTQVIMPLTAYSNTTAETMTVSLAGITGNAHIAWHVPAGGLDGWRLYIDDVVVEDIPNVVPTCSTITAPVNAAINVTNSRVTWTASLDAAGYKIYAGYAPGATDVLNGVDTAGLTTYVIPTDPGTTYYVKVVPFNATGDAVGCTEISFTTCDALLAPFLEPFNTFLPSCWSNMQGGDLTTGPISSTGSRWVVDGFANVGTTGAIRAEIYNTGANSWVISPVVSIPATGYELKLDAAATQYFATTAPTTPWEADDYVQVLVSTTGTSNWTVLHTYDNTNQPSNTGTALVVGLNAYAGQEVRFALRAFEGTANGGADIDFSIDNFEVRLTPSSVPVCATNIVATPNATCGNYANVLTWNSVSGADGYTITIGTTAGGSQVVNNVNIGNTQTYSFVGNPSTTYYYTIVPFNGAGPAIGCTENSFATVATGCYCPSTPTSVDGLGITNVQIGTTDFANTVSSSPVYSNNTTPVDMFQGISNNVQVSFDTGFGYDYNVVIWVDANDNYTFEASEIVFTGVTTNTAITTLNASFVMPLATPLGQHRMRIVATDGLQTPSNPCYSASYGETVDFTVNVIATASSDSFDNARFVAYPNPVKDVFNLSYTSEISSVRVLNLLGQEVVSKAVNATSTQVDMSQLSAGTYIVNVTVGDSIKSIKVIKQ